MYGGIGNMIKRIFLLLFVVACWSYVIANAAPLYAKAMVLKYNDTVNIYVTSAPCGIDKYKDQFPYAAKAVKNVKGKLEKLTGCFTGQGDFILIQWQDINGKPSDTTSFYAEDFKPAENTEELI